MMKTKTWLAALCAIAILAAACSRSSGGGDAGSAEPPAAVPEVTVTKVVRADVSRVLTLPAVVAAVPNQDVKISAQVAGRVAELSVAEGDPVNAGQIVARLEEGPLRDAVQHAEAAAAEARANLENAKLSLARNQDLLNRGIAARKDLEDARTAEQVAEATVEQAEADLSTAQLQLKRAQIASPLSGMVVKRFVSVGEQVDGTAGQPLIEVANLAEVDLNASVPPEELSKVRVGETISFTTGVFPDKKFAGRVVAIAATVDPATNTAQIRLRVANPDGLLRLGMNLSAEIAVETHAKALVVPAPSIYLDSEGQPRVFIVEGTAAKGTPVKVGIETPQQVELLSGAAEGVTVIVDGGYGLEDEAKVSVKSAEPAESK
jgi:RND family efflux transporter MFP subunit